MDNVKQSGKPIKLKCAGQLIKSKNYVTAHLAFSSCPSPLTHNPSGVRKISTSSVAKTSIRKCGSGLLVFRIGFPVRRFHLMRFSCKRVRDINCETSAYFPLLLILTKNINFMLYAYDKSQVFVRIRNQKLSLNLIFLFVSARVKENGIHMSWRRTVNEPTIKSAMKICVVRVFNCYFLKLQF